MDNWGIYNYVKAKKGGSGGQPVTNPALRLIDWEGTALKEYTAEQVASLTALPNPSSLRADVDRDLLTFQGYNWALADIKTWVSAHEGRCLTVGAIYTTTDGQDHNYWNNPRLTTATTISKHKRGTTTIGDSAFNGCSSLTNINIPEGVTSIGSNAFNNCNSLTDIVVKGTPSLADTNAFSNIYSDYLIYVPRAKLSWYSTATNWTTLYNNNKIVAIEDYINYLKSIGIDVREFEGE